MADTALKALIAIIHPTTPPQEAAERVAAYHDEALLNAADKLTELVDKAENYTTAHYGSADLGRSGVKSFRQLIESLRELAGTTAPKAGEQA